MDILLYQFPGACSRVALNALEEIGATYRVETVNIRGGAQLSSHYITINPKGKVPALAFDGHILTENATILYALAQRFPQAALLPRSDQVPTAYMGLSDLTWCASTLHPLVRQVRMPAKFTKGSPAEVAADGMEKFAKECGLIGARLKNDRWWYGETWSIVDVYVYWAYSTASKGGFSLRSYPELVAHAARVRERPSFKRALAVETASVTNAGLDVAVEQL